MRFGRGLFPILFIVLVLSGCKEQILHDLSETESNRLITRLHTAGISAEKRAQPDGTWALAVKRSEVIDALSALSDARVFRKSSTERVEDPGAILSSRETQRFQYERAVSREIEVTLSALSGVLESRVHLHLPPTDPLFGREISQAYPSSASVLLITDGNFQAEQEEVRKLVSGASGIERKSVAVLISAPSKDTEEKQLEQEASASSNFVIPETRTGEAVESSTRTFFTNWRSYVTGRLSLFFIAIILFCIGVVALFFSKTKRDFRRHKRLRRHQADDSLGPLHFQDREAA